MKPKRILKFGTVLFLFLSCLSFLTLPVAAEGEELPEGFFEAVGTLPEEVVDRLPEDLLSREGTKAGEAVGQMVQTEYLMETVLELVGIELGGALRLLATLVGLLLISAVFGAVRSSFASDTLSGAFDFCATAAIFSAIVQLLMKQMQGVEQFFERVSSLMGSMIPVMGTLWAMGGNVTTAAAGTGTLYVFLAVTERLCAVSVLPVCGVLTVLSLCQTLSPEVGVRGISGALKRIYTFSLGMVMTLLLASLSFQTTLTAAADSTAARATKMVTSMAIPIVGGSVGETLRTLSSGVQYMKGIVGVGGIVFLFLLVLPVLLSLILSRLAFLLSAGVAELLGCDREGKLLSELSGIWGTMIAVVAMCSVMFILALWLFIRCVVAVG